MSKYTIYTRKIDAGQGKQILIVADGTIKQQRLEPRAGGNHWYEGDGNPELVGKNIKDLRGSGFRKIRMSESAMQDFFESDPYFYSN